MIDNAAPEAGAAARSDRGWRRFAPAMVVIGLLGAAIAFDLTSHLSLESLAARRVELRALVQANPVLALLLYGLIYALAVAISLPGAALLTIAGGFLFGWLIGGAVAVLAATIGACAVFLVARSALGISMARRAGPSLERLRAGFTRDAASYLLFLRLAPVFPFWLVNLAPALLGVPLVTFAWTTLVGIVPGTFAFALAGDGLDATIAAQIAAHEACLAAGRADCRLRIDPSALVTRELVIALAALGLVALVPAALRRFASAKAP